MATYAVGDLQGCLTPLKKLLSKADFRDDRDRLWLVGDLVNRGPESLQTLQFLHERKDNIITVLGNHDLHLLACAYGYRKPGKSDTIQAILDHPQGTELCQWLRQQPLLHHDSKLNFAMTHAGIPPCWSLEDAQRLATEIQSVLTSEQIHDYLKNMYGNTPDTWRESLQGTERWRLITNYFTRMRFCNSNSKLELSSKGVPQEPPAGYRPWFFHQNRKAADQRILFGHWAALEGHTDTENTYALDTGCVWGGSLTMMHLEEERRISVTP